MNFSDSEIVASIMTENGFSLTGDVLRADLIFLNTCAIRENAEQKVRNRLREFKSRKKENPGLMVGVLGCMAERLKQKLLEEEKLVDLVVGPDAYRSLPALVDEVSDGRKAVNVLLSREETYADLSPLRFSSNGISGFVSIMRGCDNMCAFCVVPFTRGRERSRDPQSIGDEIAAMSASGFKEVTLLGQNVDSYHWKSKGSDDVSFALLLAQVAEKNPSMRIRFSTSHPKDISDEVLYTMARYENICKAIHLPVQSGSSRILSLMNRTYDRDGYLERVDRIRTILPGCGLSTDVISGFCTETVEDHQATLDLMRLVKFDFAYMFKYSERPGTLAAKKYADDVPESIKSERLQQIIEMQRMHSHLRIAEQIGSTQKVLVEGPSKKSPVDLSGRNEQNAMVVFPVVSHVKPGDMVTVIVERSTSATLIGQIIQ